MAEESSPHFLISILSPAILLLVSFGKITQRATAILHTKYALASS